MTFFIFEQFEGFWIVEIFDMFERIFVNGREKHGENDFVLFGEVGKGRNLLL